MDYRITEIGLLTRGLTVDGVVVDGTALLTFGFVASCYSSFIPSPTSPLSTSWASSPGVTLTTWTGATGTIFGPC